MKKFWQAFIDIIEIPFDPLNKKSYQANIISALLNIAISVLCVYLVAYSIIKRRFSPELFIILILLSLMILARLAIHKYKSTTISYILMGGVWVSSSIIFFFYEYGLRSPTLLAVYLFIVVYAGVIHGKTPMLIVSSISIGVTFLVAVLEYYGIYLTPPTVPQTHFTVIGLFVFFPIVVMMITRTLVNQNKTIELYKSELKNRMEAEQELRVLNQELEKRVINRTAQLSASNKEMETFSYSISHDLRAPLRSIAGFSELLMEENRESIDCSHMEYLERINQSAIKMDHMISGLLDLSRVSRTEFKKQAVNLSQLCEKIIQELPVRTSKRKVKFKITPDICAVGDERLLVILLQNLIQNAWKFTRHKETTEITFASTEKNGRTMYYIKDNGIGFEMDDYHTIFDPFKRIHQDVDFEGHGIGLATCRKIVERHHGEIWAEAQANEGAVFYFTLGNQPLIEVTAELESISK